MIHKKNYALWKYMGWNKSTNNVKKERRHGVKKVKGPIIVAAVVVLMVIVIIMLIMEVVMEVILMMVLKEWILIQVMVVMLK